MTTFTFTIDDITLSNNKLLRMHWKNRCDLRDDWFKLVKLATQYLDIPQAKKFERRKVEVNSYRLSLLDQDNLAGGMKILWDAMVKAKYLWDDNEEFLETGKPGQGRVGKRKDQRTEIRLTIFEEG